MTLESQRLDAQLRLSGQVAATAYLRRKREQKREREGWLLFFLVLGCFVVWGWQ